MITAKKVTFSYCISALFIKKKEKKFRIISCWELSSLLKGSWRRLQPPAERILQHTVRFPLLSAVFNLQITSDQSFLFIKWRGSCLNPNLLRNLLLFVFGNCWCRVGGSHPNLNFLRNFFAWVWTFSREGQIPNIFRNLYSLCLNIFQ